MLSKDKFQKDRIELLKPQDLAEPSMYYKYTEDIQAPEAQTCCLCLSTLKPGTCKKRHLRQHTLFFYDPIEKLEDGTLKTLSDFFTITSTGQAQCQDNTHPPVSLSHCKAHYKACKRGSYRPNIRKFQANDDPNLQKKIKTPAPSTNRSYLTAVTNEVFGLAVDRPKLGDRAFKFSVKEVFTRDIRLLEADIARKNMIIFSLEKQLQEKEDENALLRGEKSALRAELEKLIEENKQQRDQFKAELDKAIEEMNNKYEEKWDLYDSKLSTQMQQMQKAILQSLSTKEEHDAIKSNCSTEPKYFFNTDPTIFSEPEAQMEEGQVGGFEEELEDIFGGRICEEQGQDNL